MHCSFGQKLFPSTDQGHRPKLPVAGKQKQTLILIEAGFMERLWGTSQDPLESTRVTSDAQAHSKKQGGKEGRCGE